ncbi:S9 family peptidase [Actinomadura coerulea]|uniref:S9 family peptidase n=1 Tax=Actinomadura coerulea TaxID=46159 RepID=UPI003445B81A
MSTEPPAQSLPRERIPRQVLFGGAQRLAPSLSPDGELLAFAALAHQTMNVWVQPVDGSAPARPVTHAQGGGITEFTLCAGGRLVYRQADGGENWRLYLLDDVLDVQCEPRLVGPKRGAYQAQMLVYYPLWHPDQMLVAFNDVDPLLYDVYLLDLVTGQTSLAVTNPGHRGGEAFVSWLADSDLHVRGGGVDAGDGGLVLHVSAEPGGPLRPLVHLPPADDASNELITFTRDGAHLITATSLDAPAVRLAKIDVVTGQITTLAGDPDHDVARVWLDTVTGEPAVAVHSPGRNRYQLLDLGFKDTLRHLTSLDEGDVDLVGTARDGQLLLAATAAPDRAVRYYLHDRRTGQARLLFQDRDDLDPYELAPMQPFQLVARDGLDLHGYLTRPPRAPDGPLPAVLLVHDGPWARDTWSYRPEVQWLADQGYAVIQVNYRGSTGYGLAHLDAGNRQWGRAMQTDLLDTVAHLVGEGLIDASWVAIYGASYGGYAALCGATFHGDVFAAAVSECGPTDLSALINALNFTAVLTSVPGHSQMMEQYRIRIGDPEHDADRLRAVSPSAHTSRIRVPLLAAQGALDRLVREAETDALIAELSANRVPHCYLVFPDEGHGLVRPANRDVFHRAVEAFLAEHLGGVGRRATAPA